VAARADRACANVSPEVKEAARALLLESDWEARIKSKLPDSFPDPPAPASAAFPDDALAACSAEGKAAAAKILGVAETIAAWPPAYIEYFAGMLKKDWKDMVNQQVEHHCACSMTDEDRERFTKQLLGPKLSIFSAAWQRQVTRPFGGFTDWSH